MTCNVSEYEWTISFVLLTSSMLSCVLLYESESYQGIVHSLPIYPLSWQDRVCIDDQAKDS